MLLERFMKTVEYRITEGSDYGWQCFGPRAYRLDSWNGDQDGHTVSIIFDLDDQTCYTLEAFDYANGRAYRWTNPDYRVAHDQEARERDVLERQAWDDVDFVDLEVLDDFFAKAQAILAGVSYDTRVSVPLDLPDDELFRLMMLAHERDITLNQMIEEVLCQAINQHNLAKETT